MNAGRARWWCVIVLCHAVGRPPTPTFANAAAAGMPAAPVFVEAAERCTDAVVTFAHPFKEGDVPESLAVKAGKQPLATQVDVKRRWDDGSIKHAIISTRVPELAAHEALRLDIIGCKKGTAPDGGGIPLPDDFDAQVVFEFPDGSGRRADVREFYRKALAHDPAFHVETWLDGPLVRELRLTGPPRSDKHGADADLLVSFGVRLFEGSQAVRLEVVVESPWPDVPGNIPYDVKVVMDGREVMTEKDIGYWRHRMPYWLEGKDRSLGHFAHARWRKVFWRQGSPADIHVRYGPACITATGLIPPYDMGVEVSRQRLDQSISAWEKSPRGLLENGIVTAYFPTTGGREDLGPYPTWTTRYLLSQDPRAWRTVLGTGDLAGSFPVHLRDRRTGRVFSIDDHPGFSLNARGTFERIGPRSAADRPYVRPATSPYEVDNAHQPSLAFIPYLFTGEYYYLEEMYFWANWCMLIQNAAYRQKDRGLIAPDQVRGQAWALRQLVDAAKIAPDGHSEKAYFDAKVKSNLRYYADFIKSGDATPLGTYTRGASDAYVRGRSPEERGKWLTLAPWQQNFLAWSLDHAVRAGYAEAAGPRDYFARLQVGMLTHPDAYDPAYATPYYLVVGERVDGKERYYDTWAELFDKTFRVVASDVKPGLASGDYGGSYSYIARAVLILGQKNGLAGADKALRLLNAQLPQQDRVLTEDPTWAFE